MANGSSIWGPQVNVVDQELRDLLQNRTDPLGGAGYVSYDNELDYPEGSVGSELKSLEEQINDINVEATIGYNTFLKYGAVGDGVTLNDLAFENALEDTDRLYIPTPEVAYLISQPIVITRNNIKLLGESRLLSKIRMNNSSLPIFTIAAGLSSVSLEELYLDRSTAATATASGIECTGLSANHSFKGLNIEGQWNGMLLGETSSGQVEDCNVFRCYGNGIKQITGEGASLTWNIRDSRIYENNGHGLDYAAEGINADVILGSVDNVYALYNTGNGLNALGTVAKKLNSLRISDSVFSGNGGDGIYLDTYGARHRIASNSANSQGQRTTGRNRATAGTQLGNGVYVTGNNVEITITSNTASENSQSGIRASANLAAIVGNSCTDNGKNTTLSAEQRSGLRLATGRIVAQANIATNRTAGAGTQQVGIHITDGVNCIIAGNTAAGNMVGSIVQAGTSTTNRITNNVGYNPQAMDTVVPGTSPWTYTAGSSPESLYVKGGTIQGIAVEGQTLATAAVAATLYHLVDLEPNQSMVLTYTVVPTIIRKRK